MPAVPNLIERLLLRSNTLPGVMLDVLGGVTLRVVGAAIRFGMFEALAAAPLSATELARQLGISEAGASHMAELLRTTGYLDQSGDKYRNSAMTERWLVRSSKDSLVDFVLLWDGSVFDLWQGMEDSVREGRPALHMHDWLSMRPDGWTMFNAAMRSASSKGADEVAKRTKLPAHARRLLDVGGSHALYSAAFCRQHPELHATIFDFPEALESAQLTITEQGLQSRIDTTPGDMLEDDFGSGWDAILLFNVIHYFSAEQNQVLMRKAAAALAPGGQLVLQDQLSDHAPLPTAERFVRALSLQYFLTLGSQVYSSEEISGWLREAGFAAPRRVALRSIPGAYLIIAVGAPATRRHGA